MPAEHIIASLVTLVLSLTVPLVTPFSHRFSRRVRVNAIMIMSIATLAIEMVFTLRSHFDEHHQCRLFVLSSDNVRDFAFPCNFLNKKSLLSVLGSLSRVLSVDHLSRMIPSCRGCGWCHGGARFKQLVDNIAANFGLVGVQPVHCSRRHA